MLKVKTGSSCGMWSTIWIMATCIKSGEWMHPGLRFKLKAYAYGCHLL